jgi:hypothetical protein
MQTVLYSQLDLLSNPAKQLCRAAIKSFSQKGLKLHLQTGQAMGAEINLQTKNPLLYISHYP